MAKYRSKKSSPAVQKSKGGGLTPVWSITEPRCSICKSNHVIRMQIERLVIAGRPWLEIQRLYGIDRRSVKHHAEHHMNYEDEATRRIVESEARNMAEDLEEGITMATKRRAILDVGIDRAYEKLLNDELEMTPTDVVQMIQLRERLEADTISITVDVIKGQFQAYVRAMREIAPVEMWGKIHARAVEIYEAESNQGQLSSGD